jgi:hypothetical protein
MTWYDDAMRTIIELPIDQLEALDAVCKVDNISRAEAIRRAVALMVKRHPLTAGGRAYGLWRDRKIDGLKYQRSVRGEWDR